MNRGEAAHACLKALLAEVALEGITIERVPDGDCPISEWDPHGCHYFLLSRSVPELLTVDLAVPCVRPEEARRDVFIRFWIDGNQWIWKCAVEIIREELDGTAAGALA